MSEAAAILKAGLERWALPNDPATIEKILAHLALVREWNEKINLTGITDEVEMVIKHALDSVALATAVELKGQRLLDVGTGAGFPGVTLKLLYPTLQVTLLESLQKRARFLSEACLPLCGPGAEVVTGRAEELGAKPLHREAYDLVTARAVAELRVLAEYCLPFVKVGGLFVAMKGPSGLDEVAAAEQALATLGGRFVRAIERDLPAEAGRRHLLLIEKVKPTPKGYPRRPGTPSRKPL